MTCQRYVALLRGVPRSSSRRVAVADLGTLARQIGFSNVVTLHRSGNLVFDTVHSAAAAAAALEEALVMRLGVAARVLVLEQARVQAIVASNTLPGAAHDPGHQFVFVLGAAGQHAAVQALALQDWQPEALLVGQHAAYLCCPAGLAQSSLAAEVGKVLGDSATVRPWPLMQRLAELCSDHARRR